MSTISSGSSGLTWTSDNSSNLAITLTSIVDNTGNTVTGSTVVKGSAKAWVNFDGGNTNSAGTINSSFNVTSVTVNSTGNFTVNMTNALTNTNYTPIAKGIRGTTLYGDYGYPADALALTTSTFGVAVKSTVGTATTYYRVYAVVFA